jgi:hypothetical protein
MRYLHSIFHAAAAGLACALLSGAGVMASTVPVAESFEAYTHGHPIVNVAGWGETPSDASVVSTNSVAVDALAAYTNGTGKSYPLPDAEHAKVLAIHDEVRNSVGSETGGVVIAEWLVLPSQRDEPPAGSTNYQMAFYVSTNSELVVWHRDPSVPTNQWLTLSGNPAIETSNWVRVTVQQDYATDRFQISVDGAAYTNAVGETVGGANPGSWFHMVQTNGYLSRFRTDGQKVAYVDDMVFTNRSVSFGGASFAEVTANDGAIGTTNTITLSGDTFVEMSYVAGAHFSTSGVPAGLAVALEYVSETEIEVSVSGQATAHGAADGTNAMGLTLGDAMFTLGNAADVAGYSRSDLSVSFDNPPVVGYSSTTFLESVANNGSMGNSLTLTLTGDTFTNVTPLVAGVHYSTSGVPASLGVSVVRDSATQLTVSLTGTADAHGDSDDTSMTLNLLDAAFDTVAAANITDSSKSLSINFADQAGLSYSTTTYAETAANDGSVSGGTIGVVAEAFTGAIGTNYVLGGDVLVSNLPAGLGVSITKDSDTQVTVSFTGTATAHENGDDISNLTFAFQDSAFSGGDASAVANSTRSDLTVDFENAPVVSYGGTTFSEASNNDGSIGNTITLTLSGDTFVDDGDFGEGDEYTVANEPSGLTLSVARDSATQLTLSLTGTAASHADANDISDLTLSLQDAAFATVSAANITGATRSDMAVDFDDQPVIAYSRISFGELSGGAIDNTTPLEITLSGDTFVNDGDFGEGDEYTVANVPSGLTLVLTRNSATKLSATLTGTAAAHANANDVSDLTIVFQDAAFTVADAGQVTGYSRTDLEVDFNDGTLTVNPVPYRESFETYSDGYLLGAGEGWAPENVGVVTSEVAAITALNAWGTAFPLLTNHTQVLRMDGEISDEIKSGEGGNLYTDCMLYTTVREVPPSGSTNYQVAFYVNTNEQLVVWHAGGTSNEWVTLTGHTVTTSAWHRFTVHQDHLNAKYRVFLDGAAEPLSGPDGSWFNMVNQNDYLSRLRVLGGGAAAPVYMDDLVVGTQRPGFILPPGSLFMFR